MRRDKLTDDLRALLKEKAIVRSEGSPLMAVDIDFAGDLAVDSNGDYDFGTRFKRTGKIAWIGQDIVDNEGGALCDGCSTDPFRHGNPQMLGGSASEWPQNESARIVRVKHIETGPIVMRQPLVNQGDRELLQCVKVRSGLCKFPQCGNNVL